MLYLWCICQFYDLNSGPEVKGNECTRDDFQIITQLFECKEFSNSSILFFNFSGKLRVYSFNRDVTMVIYCRKDSSKSLVTLKLLLLLKNRGGKRILWGQIRRRGVEGDIVGDTAGDVITEWGGPCWGDMALRGLHLWVTHAEVGTPQKDCGLLKPWAEAGEEE